MRFKFHLCLIKHHEMKPFFFSPNLFASCNNTFSKWWVSIGFRNLVRQRGKEAYKLKLTNKNYKDYNGLESGKNVPILRCWNLRSCPRVECHTSRGQILNLSTRWRWVVSSMTWMLYPQEREFPVFLDRRIGGPLNILMTTGWETCRATQNCFRNNFKHILST
jgi:hypothetical protein